MPSRRDIFINGGIYHIFNKTIDHKKIFIERKIGFLFLDLFRYYRSSKADIRYSHFKRLPDNLRKEKEKQIKFEKYFKVDILGYNLMPNHFHLLLEQKLDKGIIRFMSDNLNSLTRFFNILNDRKGPIFLPQFRSRHIQNKEQLKHTLRYMDLNQYSAQLVKKLEDLEKYEFSSFREYLHPSKNNICNTEEVLRLFGGSSEKYKKFVFDNAEYQKTLELIKYLSKWL
ncbi:transposase [Candidatus Roizmanbacteria bacterium]|nr:transposase [Candidatus Roizmanbacteria bacterium]